MQLVCRFCIAARGLIELPQIDWPHDYAQWPVFITQHTHTTQEIKRLANRVSLPVALVREWVREAVPLHTPDDFNQEDV
jgi:hypothetical protein